MTANPSLFGSYGPRRVAGMFGKQSFHPNVGALQPKSPQAFGKRSRPPRCEISLQVTRLEQLRAELEALFEDRSLQTPQSPFVLESQANEPRLLVGNSAIIMIDDETGLFTFQEQDLQSGLLVVTASEERLVDHVICHLAAEGGNFAPQTANAAARMLVGQTLEDVERKLILQTLRHCHGNRTHASEILGISLRTVRNKLRSYFRPTEAEGGTG